MNLFYCVFAMCCVYGVYGQIDTKDHVIWVVKKTETVSILSSPEKDHSRIDINATLEALDKPGDLVQNVFQFLQQNKDNRTAFQSINLGSNQIEHDSKFDYVLNQLENLKNTLLTMKDDHVTTTRPETIVPVQLETKVNIESDQDSFKSASDSTKVFGNSVNQPSVEEIPNCECVLKNTCPVESIVVIESNNDYENCKDGDVCCSSPISDVPIANANSDADAFSTSIYSNCGVMPDMEPGVPPTDHQSVLLDLMPWISKVRGNSFDSFSATFIHPRAAITLASKALSMNSTPAIIQMDNQDKKVQRRVDKVVLHPQYKSTESFLENDIAILFWDAAIPVSYFFVPVCIPSPNYSFSYDEQCYAVEYDFEESSKSLVDFSVSIKNNISCKNNELCVVTNYLEKCSLNGGGPVTCDMSSHRRLVAGLTAWNGGCSNTRTFLNVAHYSQWIKDTLSNNGLSNN